MVIYFLQNKGGSHVLSEPRDLIVGADRCICEKNEKIFANTCWKMNLLKIGRISFLNSIAAKNIHIKVKVDCNQTFDSAISDQFNF